MSPPKTIDQAYGAVNPDQPLTGERQATQLLQLEYQNGARWTDVHPAVQATAQFQDSAPRPRRTARRRA